VLHGLITPHPGPLIAIASLHAQLGTTLALGIVVAIPTTVVPCGPRPGGCCEPTTATVPP